MLTHCYQGYDSNAPRAPRTGRGRGHQPGGAAPAELRRCWHLQGRDRGWALPVAQGGRPREASLCVCQGPQPRLAISVSGSTWFKGCIVRPICSFMTLLVEPQVNGFWRYGFVSKWTLRMIGFLKFPFQPTKTVSSKKTHPYLRLLW